MSCICVLRDEHGDSVHAALWTIIFRWATSDDLLNPNPNPNPSGGPCCPSSAAGSSTNWGWGVHDAEIQRPPVSGFYSLLQENAPRAAFAR